MQIETKYSGPLTINEANITTFELGMPGFEDEKAFILLPFGEGPSPYYLLQSIHTPGLAFVIMDPFTFFPDYEAALSDQTIESLAIEQESDVSLFVVLTLKGSLADSTVNLRGPIVINHVQKRGRQIALSDSDYSTQTPIPLQTVKGES
ncbi:flagellar assembly protein FliW [Alkalicoccus chagannorensis]|uniref:flagellar assembly protein FliW n=1 Tax=Alkalicoccus chagannorensis TaxID=427072 RepID=UPI00041936A9|nr:flagellar assembly protein FliW [Alkalicoccus chagannorensis]